MTQEVKDKYENKLFEIIDSEILKEEVIKTPKIKKRIEQGESIKKELRNAIKDTTNRQQLLRSDSEDGGQCHGSEGSGRS